MPVASYSILKGRPTAGKVVVGSSPHYQITVAAAGKMFTVAVNIRSVNGSEVLYAILPQFIPPSAAGLTTLAEGITPLPSVAGGLALDYMREQIGGKPMITRDGMALLPEVARGVSFEAEPANAPNRALENAVVTLLNAAVASGSATVYAFGSAFSDRGVVDGIHNIHMNQGNPANNHGSDNGVWQDGALFLEQGSTWTAVFLAFQTESWTTDVAGNPADKVHRGHVLEG